MARDIDCPICDADISLSGDEKAGDQVYCSYCRSPHTLKEGASQDEYDLEDEY